jgi:hypothetical protein
VPACDRTEKNAPTGAEKELLREKTMKQFGRTMLTVMGLAFGAALLSSNPAQAAGSSVTLVPSVGFFNSDQSELVNVEVIRANGSYQLFYQVFDFGGGLSWAGSGAIPASSVNVSGGSVNTERVMVTLNVNTCAVPGFTIKLGPCGTFNLTWVEQPASVDGSFITRGVTEQTLPDSIGGGTIVTKGQMQTFFALTTGTAIGFDLPPGQIGTLVKQTNATVTMTP